MMRALQIGIGIVLLFGLALWLVLKIFFSPASPMTDQQTQVLTTQTSYTSQTGTGSNTSGTGSAGAQGGTIAVRSYNGGVLQVKDFKSDPVTVKDPINTGHYYIGPHPYEGVPDPTVSDNPPYIIEYIDADGSFTISLRVEPLAKTRLQVEKVLKEHLGLTEEQMCQLKFTMSVPNSVNSFYAGTDLGFSFCPGATPL